MQMAPTLPVSALGPNDPAQELAINLGLRSNWVNSAHNAGSMTLAATTHWCGGGTDE